jgi:hypothetical protein
VPTVVIGTDEFIELARLEARNRGIAGLPVVTVPHPLGGIPEVDVLKKVDAAVGPVAAALAGGAAAAGRGA